MGNLWARFRHRDVRIILLGLDSAGKTTILYRLKLDDLVTTIPTIGFNVESIQYKDLHLTAWDIGSRDKIRPLFRHYYKGADAVVFVIDSHDRERLDELNYDVIKPAVGAEELTNAVFLFLANKMDLPDTMSIEEMSEKLGLRFLKHPWGILPVSAISGEGLQAALEWLAVRLGSAQVKARNFTAAQPQAKLLQECHAASSLSSSSPSGTSKMNTSQINTKTPPSQKPMILVNSKLVTEAKGNPSMSSGPADHTSVMSKSTPSSSYSAFLARKTPGTVMNSFSSYAIGQSMRGDLTQRKFSGISKSDLRKMSCASLVDAPGSRKASAASILDSPNQRKLSSASLMDSAYHRKASTSFMIEPIGGKFSNASFMEAVNARKFSATSLGGEAGLVDIQNSRKFSVAGPAEPPVIRPTCDRRLSRNSLGESQDETGKPKMSYLSAGPAASTTPPTAKRKPEDLSLSGFDRFSPIMADYVQAGNKDSATSVDAVTVTSPSDHIQPHLRALGLKKSPFLSNSAKYVVNPIDAMKEDHYNEIRRLLPERYTNLCSAGDSYDIPNENLNVTSQNQNVLSAFDDTNGNTSILVPADSSVFNAKNNMGKKQFFKSTKQTSQDSDTSSSSSNRRRSNLDLFCTPTKKSHSDKHSRNISKDYNSAVLAQTVRGAYCSRAYSAIKCLFFRPTKEEMQQETNSISSDEDKEKANDNIENLGSVDVANNAIRVEVYDIGDEIVDNRDKAAWQDCSLH